MKKEVKVGIDNLLISWTEYEGKSRTCREILDIYFFCAGFMQETAKRRKELEIYYKFAPLLAEEIEGNEYKQIYYFYLGKTIAISSFFISTCRFKEAYKEFKKLIKRLIKIFYLN